MIARGATHYSPGSLLPELVAAAIDGNNTAWSALVERFAPLVTVVTRRFRLTESDADDVAQTVWLRLVEHLADLREPRALPGWVVTTTRNEAVRLVSNRYRVDLVDPLSDARLDSTKHDDVATNLLRVETSHAVSAGLAELDGQQRELLLLTFADPKISYRQIGQLLGMPAGSVGPTRARCLTKLKNTNSLRALAS